MSSADDQQQYRAVFDADIAFANGGGLQAQGFRVDLPSQVVTEQEVGALFVASLGLLMSEDVHITALRVIAEPHKGTRGGPSDTSAAPSSVQDGASTSRQRWVELSHVITAGMTTYPGLPAPEITPHLTREDSRAVYAAGTEFAIDRITMVGNTGTYLDSPFHRYSEGSDLAGLPLDSLADLPVVVVRATGSRTRAIGVGVLAAHDVAGCAVLLHTGSDDRWGTEAYGHPSPYLDEAGARWLVEHDAALVGIDSVNIDDTSPEAGGARPAHSILLAAGVPVVEHLTGLGQLPPSGARFTAVPPRVAGFGTFPVRAYALVPQRS